MAGLHHPANAEGVEALLVEQLCRAAQTASVVEVHNAESPM